MKLKKNEQKKNSNCDGWKFSFLEGVKKGIGAQA
jgi:hypothetical protein